MSESKDDTDNKTLHHLNNIKPLACASGRKKRDTMEPQPPPLTDYGGSTPDWLTTEYDFLAEYMQLNESIRHSIGHQFGALIKSCTFRGYDCTNSRFVLYIQKVYKLKTCICI